MVSVPVRSVGPGFAATIIVTVPLPVPEAPLVIVTQSLSDAAVHAHWLVVVTPTVACPPDAGTESVVTDSV